MLLGSLFDHCLRGTTMARTTPRVDQKGLLTPANCTAPILLGSQQWFSWLSDEANRSFFFENEVGSFTARKERRQRGGLYWIAYRSREGKLTKSYIGRSKDLTPERLREVASFLASQKLNASASTTQTQSLLATRFMPPLLPRGYTIERTKLLARLDESLKVKLTLVTAPAGFGKTTLLTMWYQSYRQRRGQAITWVTLDERDNDPARFWSAIWNTLQQRRKTGSIDISVPLSSTPQMSIETVLAALLSGKQHGVLILDDYHVISNQQIHDEIDLLLSHLPPAMHLIISSRSEPPLTLGRARMGREVYDLRVSDLKLSPQEIERFWQGVSETPLSPEEMDLLQLRTEGWIAGLQLAVLALRGQSVPGEALARFSGSQRSLFDYFAEEVLTRQPEEVQHFLLSTSLLPLLTAPLCAALLDEDEANAQRLLVSLEQANLFLVPLDEQRLCYRYHTLFGEFLSAKLQQSAPERVRGLQMRAGGWYEQQGMREEAIEWFLAAQQKERSRQLIEQLGEEILWKRGEVKRLLSWLQQLRPSAQPRLEVLYAWTLLLSGQRHQQEVENLLGALESQGVGGVGDELRGDIAALRARIAAFHNDASGVVTYSQQALQVLPPERALLRADITFGLSGTCRDLDEMYRRLAEALHISQAMGSMRTAMFSSRYLADTCVEQGRLIEAEAILQQALQMANSNTGPRMPASGVIHVGFAELLYERNLIEEALRHALIGVELGEQSGEIKAVQAGRCTLSQIFAARGEMGRAWQELWNAERVATIGGALWLNARVTAISVHLSLLQRDTGGAKRSLRKLGIDPDKGLAEVPAATQGEERLLLARLWLAEEKYQEVVALLEPVILIAHQEKRTRRLLLARTMQALSLSGLKARQQRVTRLLQETLNNASPAGYVRLFLDLGEPLRGLLARSDLSGPARSFARRLLAVFEDAATDYSNARSLSEREYEVLQLVATGMSNAEIAETLVIALSTVKAHMRNLCQKLNVQKRIQAVAKAREKGLL